MKKIIIMLTMLVGLVAGAFANTVFVENIGEESDDGVVYSDFYNTECGLCTTCTRSLRDELDFCLWLYHQPTYVGTAEYADVDTFMFVENKYDYYFFRNEEQTKYCFVFPLDEEKVIYMWFINNGK